jgi:hypothetical protein
MNLGGFRKISLFQSNGTVIQFNNIGSDGEFKNEPFAVEKANGSKRFAGDNYAFKFVSYDLDGYNQLMTWLRNNTELNMVVFGVDSHIMWRENTLITVERVIKFKIGDLEGIQITIEKKGGELKVYSGVNILKAEFGWQDANSDGRVDNYDLQPTNLPFTFANGVQSLTATAPCIARLNKPLVFPISGAKLRFRMPVTTNVTNVSVTVKCYNYNMSVLQTVNGAINSNVDFITPSGIWKIEVIFDFELNSIGESLSFTQPYLGVQDYESA